MDFFLSSIFFIETCNRGFFGLLTFLIKGCIYITITPDKTTSYGTFETIKPSKTFSRCRYGLIYLCRFLGSLISLIFTFAAGFYLFLQVQFPLSLTSIKYKHFLMFGWGKSQHCCITRKKINYDNFGDYLKARKATITQKYFFEN